MERRLIVMRHARSVWSGGPLGDHGRCLAERGRPEALSVAKHLVDYGWIPQQGYSSDATRTQQTWQAMTEVFQPTIPLTFTRRFYQAGFSVLREESLEWDPSVETMLALGHNPGWEQVVAKLSGQYIGMAPGTAVLLVGQGSQWSIALDGEWSLSTVIGPEGAI
jgi:phosphohistidine phosphatase